MYKRFVATELSRSQLTNAKMAHKRVLVYAQKARNDAPVKLPFHQSVLDYFGCEGHLGKIHAKLSDNKVIVSGAPLEDGQMAAQITRPPFCPIHNMTKDDVAALPVETKERGIDTGVATVVETSDNKVLLIRRAAHLRTFPGVWVPPGGHIEWNETLHETGFRELEEESGLSLKLDMCEKQCAPIIGLWESVYPPMLSAGLPKRHHIVVYVYIKLAAPYTEAKLQPLLKLDPEEVGASAWLDQSIIEAIVKTYKEEEKRSNIPQSPSGIPEKFKAVVVSKEKQPSEELLPTAVLLNCATGNEVDIERVSTGTKFALQEWLKLKRGNASSLL